ncbi:MAG: hypothetical protein ACKN9F_06690 [Methylomonas sp.]
MAVDWCQYVESYVRRIYAMAELWHDNFMAKVPKVLGEDEALKCQGVYLGGNGQERPMYRFGAVESDSSG